MLSFRDIVLALTDVALLVVFVTGILLAATRMHERRRSSMLVIMALSMLVLAKLATFSLAFWARTYSLAAMENIVAYVKMGNTALLIFAVATLVTAVYAQDKPLTDAQDASDWNEDAGSRAQHAAFRSRTATGHQDNPFRAPGP